jgi:hypothetical protein
MAIVHGRANDAHDQPVHYAFLKETLVSASAEVAPLSLCFSGPGL